MAYDDEEKVVSEERDIKLTNRSYVKPTQGSYAVDLVEDCVT